MLPLIQSLRLCSLPRFRLLSSPLQTGRSEAVIGIRRNARRLCSTAEVSDYELDELHEDGRVVERENALHQALTQLAPDFGRESMLSLQRFFSSRRAPVISTGSLKLDLALGIGGLPKGRMVEIYGQEASGKTTLALHIIKEAQKLGGYCAYLDVENAMDPSLPESMGIDTENLLISPPDSAENLLNVVDTLTKSGSVDVIVVDSVAVCGWAIFAAIKVTAFNMAIKVAALVPQQEIDTVIGGQKEDRQARIMTQALRKIHHSLCQSQTVIIFLNQVRSDVKSVQGFGRVDEVTCGGNALKFYSAVRLRMNRTRLLKTENKPTGLGVCVQVIKNKLGLASKKAELGIRFGRGFCVESEVLELACEHGIIMVEGGNYLIEGETFSNRNEAERFLSENDEALDNIVSSLRRQLFESGNFMRPLNR